MNKMFGYCIDNKGVFIKFNVFIVLFSLYCTAVQAVENGSMPYKNINKMLIIINKHAKSPYTGLIASLTSNEKSLDISDVEISITYDEKLIETVSVNKKGLVQFPLLDKELGDKAKIMINQPKGLISMELNAGIKPIRTLQVSYDELFGVLDDLETVATELVGLPSWMLPDLDYLEFYFESSSTVNLKGAGIDEFYKSNTENKIKIERISDLYNRRVSLIFSDIPIEVKFLN